MILQQGQLDEQEAPDNGGDDPLNRSQLPPALAERMRNIDPQGDVGAISPALAERMSGVGTGVNQIAGAEIAEAPSAFESEREAGAPLDVPERAAAPATFAPPSMPEAQNFRVQDSEGIHINVGKEGKQLLKGSAITGGVLGTVYGGLSYANALSAGAGQGLAAGIGAAGTVAAGLQAASTAAGLYVGGAVHDLAWTRPGEKMPERTTLGRMIRGPFSLITAPAGYIWTRVLKK